jgi:prevent-host-death family protein
MNSWLGAAEEEHERVHWQRLIGLHNPLESFGSRRAAIRPIRWQGFASFYCHVYCRSPRARRRRRARVCAGEGGNPAHPGQERDPHPGIGVAVTGRGKACGTATNYANVVTVTRISKPSGATRRSKPGRKARDARSGPWLLRDAKAHFSELVRRVRSEGPQHVTVHGENEVVVIAAEEFRRLRGEQTGAALVEAMQASPYREIDLEPERYPLRVRDVPFP